MRQSAPPPKSGWLAANCLTHRVCVSHSCARYDGNNPGKMTRLDRFLAYLESRRLTVCVIAALLTASIAWVDWQLPDVSIGFLYLFPILLAAPALNTWQILLMAAFCGFLREAFDPLRFARGASERIAVVTAGDAMTGFFVTALNQRRRNLACLLYTSDAADDLLCGDLGGRR